MYTIFKASKYCNSEMFGFVLFVLLLKHENVSIKTNES